MYVYKMYIQFSCLGMDRTFYVEVVYFKLRFPSMGPDLLNK